MLGNSSIQFSNKITNGIIRGNARYSMTMSTNFMGYMQDLCNTTYAPFSPSRLYPYPNPDLPQHVGKDITQYNFYTKRTIEFTELHSIWYE
jgi:hypothetical protein